MDPLFINFTKQDDEVETEVQLQFNVKSSFPNISDLLPDVIDNIPDIVKCFPFQVCHSRNMTDVNEHCVISQDHIYLLPSVFILLLLSFVERRQKVCSFEKRFPYLSGRFGIVVPLDFTSSMENRWSHAFAFGAVTPLIFSLFFGFTNPIPYTPPRYLKVFVYLVAALEVGFICKPFFACLSAPNQMLGGILGLLYTLTWFIIELWDLIWCKWPTTYDDKSFEGFSLQYEWLLDIPHLLCLGFLLFRFGFIIVKDMLIRLKRCDKQVVKKHQYRYVQRLLRRSAEVFIIELWDLIWCKWPTTYDDKSFEGFSLQYEWLLDIPHLLCLGFLLFRFGFIIVKDMLIRLKRCDKQVVKKHQYRYVQRLLRRSAEVSVQKSWFQRKVYDWDPYFKFPNRIIATVVLCCIGIVLCEQIISSWCIRNIYKPWPDYIEGFLPETTRIIHLNYVTYSWYITSVCAAVSSVTHISHVMVYYRKHIKSLWAGDNKYLLKTYNLRAAASVAGLLKYPGYQIAFTLWGYLIVHVAMFTVALLFVYLVISPIHQYGFLPWLLDLISFLTNFFIMFILMRFQRVIITLFFLQDKASPQDKEKPLALKNRKVFHNFNYYLFFFNLILGIGSCVLRVIRSAVVALMLLSRIERTIMPQGFKKLDTSHLTWVGMIITDHHHSNPVLVCFCHLLLKHTLQSVRGDEGVIPVSLIPDPAAKKRALLRWVLLYTLLRNPGLILLRKRRWDVNREALELAFIWAMTRHRDINTAGAGRSALTLISALHGSSFAYEDCLEGLRRTCPP